MLEGEYYETTSEETIKIRHRNEEIVERPLMVKGMRKHEERELQALRGRSEWTIPELRKVEGW